MSYDNSGKKKRVAVIGVSSLILVAMVVAVTVGVNQGTGSSNQGSGGSAPSSSQISTSTKAVQAICQPTDYKETCEESLSSAAGNTTDPKELIKIGFQVAIKAINQAMENSSTVKELQQDARSKEALHNCKELMESSIDELKQSFDKVGEFDYSKLDEYIEDLKVWLSGSITYQETCMDGFDNSTQVAQPKMREIFRTAGEMTRNGLAMVSGIQSILTDLQIPGVSRRLFSADNALPAWVDSGRRKLLAATGATVKADVVVAKDGSGKFKTVGEALNLVPKKSTKPFVIYIKAGIYKEIVLITKSMTNVVLIGDGPTKTKITGSLNYVDGVQTYKTATVAAVGAGFIAKDMGFENSAGSAKHQAVALRVASDMSIIYNCQIDGYQDTLYTHTQRQFYRDCIISGTIDFIFGDAPAVFQNCKMIIRMPGPNQQCIVTAQGRLDRREPTALVLQNCTIAGDPAYLPNKDKYPAYLGRPWKQYSRTIIMNSQIDDVIQPAGWLPWAGDFGLATSFYAEVNNRGPGAATTSRVKWRAIKQVTSDRAIKFTPGTFISGDRWIKPTGIPYVSGPINVQT